MNRRCLLLFLFLSASSISCQSGKEYPADKDREFFAGSRVDLGPLRSHEIENLAVLGKLWGFLKYYHPRIAAGEYNWDYELLRILPAAVKPTTRADRDTLLAGWMSRLGLLGPLVQDTSLDRRDIHLLPDLGWLEDTLQLGPSLTPVLKHIRYARRPDDHFYIGPVPGRPNPGFTHENPYILMPYPDPGFRLLALFRYWNMIEYFFPYRYLIEEDWNDILSEFIPKFLAARTQREYTITAGDLICRVHDSHATVTGDQLPSGTLTGTRIAPVRMMHVEGKAVVSGFYNDERDRTCGLLAGDVLLTVDGVPVDSLVRRRLPHTPGSNTAFQMHLVLGEVLRTNAATITITYERNGRTGESPVRCVPLWDALSSASGGNREAARLIGEDIGYIYAGRYKNSLLPAIMEEFKATRGLIVDLRCYPSDFLVYTLTRYLLPQSVPFVKLTVPSIHTPGVFRFIRPLTVGARNPECYKGTVAILVNETTMSQAEFTAMALRTAPRAVVVGSTTAAADGDVVPIVLPGGIATRISGLGVYYPDGRETQRVGILPDVVVRPTIKGIREGRDEVLEKAIEVIRLPCISDID